MVDRDGDTTVLCPVISPGAEVGQILLNVVAVIILDNSTDTKRGFVGVKVYYREFAIAYPHYSFRTCGHPEAFTSTTIF